jgi:transposase
MPPSPISPCPSCPPHAAGGHGCAVYPSSVTDAEWTILEPLLPAPGSTAGRSGRPEKHCRRVILDAIVYFVRGGIAWRQLLVEFPPAGTVYAVFARWARRGRGSASSTRCATDCGCGPGGTGARPRRSSTRRRYPPPTPCPDPAAAGMRQENERRQAAHRGGCERPAARRRRYGRLDPGPRRPTPTPDRTARAASPPSGWSGPTAVTPDGTVNLSQPDWPM